MGIRAFGGNQRSEVAQRMGAQPRGRSPNLVGPQWKNRIVADRRFTTECDDLQDLLRLVDVDEVGDIETLLMFLFARPIGVEEVWDDDGVPNSLDVTVQGVDESVGSVYEFPMSVMGLVRSCAHQAAELGPYPSTDPTTSEETQHIVSMSDVELTTALQQALGSVRIFNLMDSDG